MANGWFRASGQPGVCAGIPGPGFAWSLPPLAEASLDSAAILFITGKPRNRGYNYDLQVINQREIASALDCPVFDVDDTNAIAETTRLAWQETTRNGPRPVVLQIAPAALEQEWTNELPRQAAANIGVAKDWPREDIVMRLKRAKRTVVLAGAGTLAYAEKLKLFVNATGSALFTTPTARGVIDEAHPMCLRVDFVCDKTDILNEILESADLIFALGCRFSHNGSGGFRLALKEDKLIHVDIDGEVLQANYTARWPLCMDVGRFIDTMLNELPSKPPMTSQGWTEAELDDLRARISSKRSTVSCEPVWREHGDCPTLFRKIRAGVPENAAIVTDTGLHQILARTYLDVRCPRGLIFPSDFQSMGFGLPAAIGAALSDESRPVVALIGDGSFLTVGAELLTAKREGLSLPVLVFCDGTLGQIRLQQIESFGHEAATRLEPIDLEVFAKSMGIEYALAGNDLSQQLEASFTRGRPTLIEVRLEDGRHLKTIRNKTRAKNAAKAALGSKMVRILKRISR
jgi:acetolactate synthase-1/2/3 large subunit